jgi:hypothetical protein
MMDLIASHSHDAAFRAVAMVREDWVDAMMTDSVHADELMGSAEQGEPK